MNTVYLNYALIGKLTGVSQSSVARVLDRVDLNWTPPDHPDDTEPVAE